MFTKPRTQTSFLWRIGDVVCAFLVIFYILFDVLDLDGSNACRIAIGRDHLAMVGETDADFQFDGSSELSISPNASIPLVEQYSKKFIRPPKASAIPLSAAGGSHGDRGCRIESSASGTSPDH